MKSATTLVPVVMLTLAAAFGSSREATAATYSNHPGAMSQQASMYQISFTTTYPVQSLTTQGPTTGACR